MDTQQMIAVIGAILGAPIMLEVAKQWFGSRTTEFQSKDKAASVRSEREWSALKESLDRERSVYADILSFERQQFANRLAEIEAKLGKIQEDSHACQKAYWEERLIRERLQERVEILEKELAKRSTE